MSDVVYGRDPVFVLTSDQATGLDRRARDTGVPERALMENAGRAAAQVIHRLHPTGRVVAVVGSGNNGGDALVALRSLREWGREVAYVYVGSGVPDAALLTGADVPRREGADVAAVLAGAAVLVDGILGTGSRGEPREPAAAMIHRMGSIGVPVVALDIPSGVDPTTGAVPGVAVTAAATISFGWPKTGAVLHPGRSRCGRLIVVEIGFPPLEGEEAGAELITPDWARARLPVRPPDAHKNSVGRVLIVAGRTGMAGAAAIAGHSAVRAGAGYVRIASPEANRGVLQSLVPEALFVDRADHAALRDAVAHSDAVLIGPALGTDRDGGAILDLVLEAAGTARAGCVLDADALTILAGRKRGFHGLNGGTLLTPHPGEMSRITGLDIPAVRADPIGAARDLAAETGVAVLLKGAPSVVAVRGRRVLVSSVGSSEMATAGMGDQLGGAAAAFLAGLRAQAAALGAAPLADPAAAIGDAPPTDQAAALGAALPADPAIAGGLALFYGGRAAGLARRGRSLSPHDVADAFHNAFDDPGPDRSDLDLPFVLFDQPAPC